MGHLLKTVNPEAAEAIKPEEPPFAIREPYVGEIVQYFARPGEGRAGKMVFPALMRFWHEDGRAELTVMYACDDFRDYINQPKKTPDKPWASWDFVPTAFEAIGVLNVVKGALFGDHPRVPESVYDMLLGLENQVQKLQARIKKIEDREERIAENRRNALIRARAAKAGGEIEKDEAENPTPSEPETTDE